MESDVMDVTWIDGAMTEAGICRSEPSEPSEPQANPRLCRGGAATKMRCLSTTGATGATATPLKHAIANCTSANLAACPLSATSPTGASNPGAGNRPCRLKRDNSTTDETMCTNKVSNKILKIICGTENRSNAFHITLKYCLDLKLAETCITCH